MSENLVLITGASSGFGARTARAFADAGDTVYAALAPPGAEAGPVSGEIARVVALPAGKRPYRVHIDPADDGSEEVSEVADRIRRAFLTRVDLADLLTVPR